MTDSLELRDIERILELVDLTAFEWHGSHIICEQSFGSRSVSLIEALYSSPCTEVELKKHGQFVTDLTADEVFYVKIDLPKGKDCCLVKTADDLLSSYYLHSVPDYHAIAHPRYLSWKPDQGRAPPIIERLDASRILIQKLEENEIIERDGHNRSYVVHTHAGKTNVPFQSERGYLNGVSAELGSAIEVLNETFKDTLHLSEKKRIFRNAIADAMKSCDSEMRIRHLLKHASEILLSGRNNYDLFVSSFSFQNDQEKLYEQKRDFNVKLNNLLSGIQGKLLAIPVSTILAISQLKDVGEESFMLINSAIIFSSGFFTLIISWLIVSQLAALDSINTEITAKEKRFKVELPRMFNEVESVFTALKSSCSFNTKAAKVILALSIFLFVLTFYVYVLKTPLLHEALAGLYRTGTGLLSAGFERVGGLIVAVRSRI